ncbi:MAG: hypothetical protein V1806_15620 [Pseudomonadota bacterium]
MMRLRLFGRSSLYHDPIAPVLKSPAQVGWQAWFRETDQVASEPLSGHELLLRARGAWTVEPQDVAAVVALHGRLVVGGDGELLVELADQTAALALALALREGFGDEVLLAP